MKCTILGVGDVEGHPIATFPDSYNLQGENKLRPGFLVTSGNDTVVFDISPDIRQQLLYENVKKISAIFVTHAHFDHFWGIADLSQLNWVAPITFPVYINSHIEKYLSQHMPWIKMPFQIYQYNKEYIYDGFTVTPIKVSHSEKYETAGFLIKSSSGKTVFYAPDYRGVEKQQVTCNIAVVDGCYFFGKYIEDNDEHLGPEELKIQIDKLEAEQNYLMGIAPFYYKKTTEELRKRLPKKYYLPDNFMSFEI